MKIGLYTSIGVVLLLLVSAVSSRLKIDIVEGVEGGIPVAVLAFDGEDQAMERTYSSIIASDLAYSGLFSLVDRAIFQRLSPPMSSTATYSSWADKGVEKLISGIVQRSQGNVTLRVSLFDIVGQKKLADWKVDLNTASPSVAGHQISDLIYEELTGFVGIYSTRLAFVSSERSGFRKRKYHLNIADADGYNIVSIFDSDELLMSPTWSPDYQKIAYISYENNASELFIQELSSGRRESYLGELGQVNSVDWSGDGSKLAYVSSRDGNPEIYVYDFLSEQVVRMTNNLAIDTEPSWAPNNMLYFTSDRSGAPQIYRIVSSHQAPQRVTFEGRYNSDLDVSPQGDKITYVSARGAQFSVIVRDLNNQQEAELSFGALEERPRFAPNGQLLSYLTQQDGRTSLGLLTTDGAFGKLIPIKASYVRAVAWSPVLK